MSCQTRTGTLPAEVHLYTTSAPGALAQYIDLVITKGTQLSSTFPDCSGFTADGAAMFTGTLQSFEQTRNSFAAGIDSAAPGHAVWAPGDSVVYKIDATLQAGTPDAGQGSSSGHHTFVWEARNV